ncbi:MAG TPA: TPM domain-containing protein, partial [Candidatus Baltobacteraceae bacterium]|nr:TPM domain-containing protein [Candidatus Baltobacteraceae bacterium]
MKRFGAAAGLGLALLAGALPAHAATSFVQDGASMFSSGTVAQLQNTIGSFNAQTGKEIVVVTVPSLGGDTLQAAAQKVFSEQQINGVLIFIAKDDRKDIIVPGRATAAFFPAATTQSIRQSMESQFRSEDYDGGITTAVGGVLDVFRAHTGSLQNANGARSYNYPATTSGAYAVRNTSGVHISMFWWIIIIVFGFMILRSIMRAASGPRYYGGAPGAPGPGGPGYGGPGYGGYG